MYKIWNFSGKSVKAITRLPEAFKHLKGHAESLIDEWIQLSQPAKKASFSPYLRVCLFSNWSNSNCYVRNLRLENVRDKKMFSGRLGLGSHR